MQRLSIPLQQIYAVAAMCLLRTYCGLEVDRGARHDTRVSFRDSICVIVNIRIFSSARNQFDYASILFSVCSFRLCCRLAIRHPVNACTSAPLHRLHDILYTSSQTARTRAISDKDKLAYRAMFAISAGLVEQSQTNWCIYALWAARHALTGLPGLHMSPSPTEVLQIVLVALDFASRGSAATAAFWTGLV